MRGLLEDDSIVRVFVTQCGGERVRGRLTLSFERACAPERAEAVADVVVALAEAAVRLYPLPEAAMGSESAICEKIIRKIPEAHLRSLQLALYVPGAFATTATRKRPAIESAQSERGRVLVVDDDDGVRATLGALLADEFDVTCAASAGAAEREVAGGKFDLVLTDYDMPGDSGLDLLRRLQKVEPALIGILLTGHGEYAEVMSAKKDHAIFRVLLKPYNPEMVIASIRTAISLARMRAVTARLAASGS